MFSLQKLLSKDSLFFDLLNASAKEAETSVQSLASLLANPGQVPSLKEFHASKEQDKKITEQINEALIDTFVTEIEKEDVEMLSAALYQIPKTVEKFAERFIISVPLLKQFEFGAYISMLKTATQQVTAMVDLLSKKPGVAEIKSMNQVIQNIEGDADKLILERVAELFSGKYDPLQAMALKDLYELLEKTIDRCRDAGNVVTQIIIRSA